MFFFFFLMTFCAFKMFMSYKIFRPIYIDLFYKKSEIVTFDNYLNDFLLNIRTR